MGDTLQEALGKFVRIVRAWCNIHENRREGCQRIAAVFFIHAVNESRREGAAFANGERWRDAPAAKERVSFLDDVCVRRSFERGDNTVAEESGGIGATDVREGNGKGLFVGVKPVGSRGCGEGLAERCFAVFEGIFGAWSEERDGESGEGNEDAEGGPKFHTQR
jgi:hypothetical protein